MHAQMSSNTEADSGTPRRVDNLQRNIKYNEPSLVKLDKKDKNSGLNSYLQEKNLLRASRNSFASYAKKKYIRPTVGGGYYKMKQTRRDIFLKMRHHRQIRKW
jgi:hypothetical protein